MADEFQLGSGNWWESSSSRNLKRYESRVGTATTSTSSLHNSNNNNSMGSFGTWPTEIVDIKARSSMDSLSVSGSSISLLHFPNNDSGQKLPLPHESSPSPGLLPDPNLQIMGLGLSSQTMDWNQALFRGGEKGGEGSGGFRSTLQEEASNTNFHQQEQQWRHKIYPSAGSSENSSRLSLDHSNMTSGSSNVNQPDFPHHQQQQQHNQLDSYGFFTPDNQQQQMNYSYPMMISSSYGMSTSHDHQLLPSWSNSNKFPQFLQTSPPKQPPQQRQGQLQFSNNAPFWNASSTSMNDIVAAAARPSGLFPSSLQSQLPLPNFNEKPKNTSEARDLAIAKKNSNETSSKRPRNETPAPMPAFKVRKEKMGDRITALQQLVSPFGKTDTASVLSEAIEYIKFLHEQVSLLSTPYMKSGAPVPHAHHQHLQNPDKSKDPEAVPKQDLRSRGLCLVPVSSTFPVTHETTVDFWTPTYGGTFR